MKYIEKKFPKPYDESKPWKNKKKKSIKDHRKNSMKYSFDKLD